MSITVTFKRHSMDKQMWEMITQKYRTIWAVVHQDLLSDLYPQIDNVDEIVVEMVVKDD